MDYIQKANDMVLQAWIKECQKTYKISPKTTKSTKHCRINSQKKRFRRYENPKWAVPHVIYSGHC